MNAVAPVALLLLSWAAWAGTTTRTPATPEPPTGGRFYIVQANGESKADDPVAAGFAARPDPRLSGPHRPSPDASPANDPAGSARPARPPKPPQPARPRSPMRAEAAAFRCEQFGFYYTKAGRCVVPRYVTYPSRSRY